MQRPHWFVKGLGIILALITVWIASALLLTVASAGGNPFSMGLGSNLAADYSGEGSDLTFGPIKLSILQEALIDLGLGSDEAGEKAGAYISDMDDPVPTATAVDFEGDPPYTPTPEVLVETPTPTLTATPEANRTPFGVQATSTKVLNPTPLGTKMATLTPCCDSVKPTLSGGFLSPPTGPLSICTIGVTISTLRVVDPAPSSGIMWVKVKYKVEGPNSRGYVYSADLSPPSGGGWSGSTWDAVYYGSITIDFDAGYSYDWGGRRGLALAVLATATPTPITPTATYTPLTPTATYTPVTPTATHTPGTPTSTPIPTPFTVKVWAGAKDNDGNEGYLYLGSYTMPASCD